MNDPSNPQNILIIKNRAIGDAVMTLSSVSYIKEQFSSANIYFGVPQGIHRLFEPCDFPQVQIIPIKLANIADYLILWKQLHQYKIDMVIELHQGGRTGRFFKFWQRFGKRKYYYHNHHLKSGGFIHDQGVIKPLIQRDLDACFSVSKRIKPDCTRPDHLAWTPNMPLKAIINKDQNLIIFGVVATRETKMWPLRYYKELAVSIIQQNPNKKILIPLSNSREDQLIEKDLKSLNLPDQVTFLKVPLHKLPEEMASASLYIGNDTGLKHIALALGIKTYTFFGPEPPNEWHPYDKDVHPYFFIEPLECRTLKAHYCGLSKCDSMICLNQFQVSDVYQKIFNSK